MMSFPEDDNQADIDQIMRSENKRLHAQLAAVNAKLEASQQAEAKANERAAGLELAIRAYTPRIREAQKPSWVILNHGHHISEACKGLEQACIDFSGPLASHGAALVAEQDARIAALETEVMRLRGWLTSIEGDTCPLGEDFGDSKVYQSAKDALAGKSDGALIRLMSAQRENAASEARGPLEAEIVRLQQDRDELPAILAKARREGAARAYDRARRWISPNHTFEQVAEWLMDEAAKFREAVDA